MSVEFECPNLDAMSESDLKSFRTTFETLSAYCAAKRLAMRARQSGRIADATAHERECESLYQSIPEGARW